MIDFIRSLEDDFGFYNKDEDFYRVVDEDLKINEFFVLNINSYVVILNNPDVESLELLAKSILIAVKVIKNNQLQYFSDLAVRYDKKLLGLNKVDAKNDKYWLVECLICNTKSSLRSRFFDRCLGCKSSKGEKRITRYLRERKVKFETQQMFKDLRYINPLKLDFYLPLINTAIEFHGEQHTSIDYYIRIGATNPEKSFRDCQIRDEKKREWCKKNNIRLIEIHYYDFNRIESILDELLFVNKVKSFI